MADDNDFLNDISSLVAGASPSAPTTTLDNPVPVNDNTVADVVGAIDKSFQSDTTNVTQPPKQDGTKADDKQKAPAEAPKADDQKQTAAAAPTEQKATTDGTPATAGETADKGKSTSMLDTFLQQDDKNNLVTSDGTIIATAGKSRAFFQKLKEEGRFHRQQAMQLAQSQYDLGEKFKQLFQEYTKVKDEGANNLAKATGMSQEEIPEAIALMKQYRADPKSAIKRLLTQARMRGIDLSDIGINGGIDPSVVREMIDAAKQAQTPAPETTPAMTEEQAATAAQTFLANNPDAVPHVEALANAKRRFPEMSLERLWIAYKIHMTKLQEQAVDAQLTTVVTQQSNPPANRYRQKAQPVVQPASRNYENMSYSEIAAQIARGQ